MTESQTRSSAGGAKRRRDRIVKLGFLVVAVLAAYLVWRQQRSAPPLPSGWGTDLAAAMQQARTQDKRVLVLLTSKPPSEAGRTIIRERLSKRENIQAVRDGNLVAVHVEVSDPATSELMKRYSIPSLPALLLLGPGGWEYNRRVGNVGETEFRNELLGATGKMVIVNPGVRGWQTDLKAGLARAATERKQALLLFTPRPADANTELAYVQILGDSGVRKAIADGGYVLIHQEVQTLQSSSADLDYGVKALPCLVALSSRGDPYNRLVLAPGRASRYPDLPAAQFYQRVREGFVKDFLLSVRVSPH